ncbi:hypothetical protein MSAN_01777700 [Mycena sanguinolenta]|uniref:Uncharacterized protein n=1 Tax=Mycena sanguinolenta TaxID=230812 RepID=A0A8H6XX89_9AGAR|nr:hypothetical protein MSAN_01777700 [Mycena sanguinolenta]
MCCVSTFQPRIFRCVTLLPPRSEAPGSSEKTICFLFHHIVTQSHHIQRYVRTLVIMDRNLHFMPGRREPKEWMLEEPTLPLLFRLLSNLESLHIHARFRWSELLDGNPALSAAILSTLASPKIKSIFFRGIGDLPLSSTTQSPGLEDLLLNNRDLKDEPTPVIPPPKIRLHRLGLGAWTLIRFARADCPFDITHLRKLRVCPQHMDAASESLLEFEYLPFPNIYDAPPHPDLNLGKLSSLRRFVIWVVLGKVRAQRFAPLLWLPRALDSFTADSALQYIDIHLDEWSRIVYCTADEPVWATLDASLTRPELSTAIVTIFTSMDLNMRLPRLVSSGRMRVDNTGPSFGSVRYADL